MTWKGAMQTQFKRRMSSNSTFFLVIIVSHQASADIPRLRAQCIWGNTINVARKVGHKPTGGNIRERGSLLQPVC